MERRKLRIGELAKRLQVERFVIRFWEKEFGIKPRRSSGGQRFYTKHDVKTFETIRHLLHDKKFTIAGAKQMLQQKHQNTPSEFTASEITSLPIGHHEANKKYQSSLLQQLHETRKQLKKIQSILTSENTSTQ